MLSLQKNTFHVISIPTSNTLAKFLLHYRNGIILHALCFEQVQIELFINNYRVFLHNKLFLKIQNYFVQYANYIANLYGQEVIVILFYLLLFRFKLFACTTKC